MTMDWLTVGALKYRRLVAHHGPRLAVALAVTGLLVAGGGAAQFANPPTEQVTETVHEGSVDTSVTTEAVVTGESRFYDRGTVLVDEPVYLRSAAPELTVTAGTAVTGEGETTVEQSLVLVYRAEVGDDRFWTRERALTRDEATVKGEEATVAATLNVSEVAEQLRTYQKELGGEGTVTVALRHGVRYRTAHHEGEIVDDAPLVYGGRTYALGDGLEGTQALGSERTREVPDADANVVIGVADHDMVLAKAGFAWHAVAAVLLGLAADVWARHRQGVDVTAVERHLERTQFEEWISEGHVDTDVGTHHVPVASLADLVDLGIDCDRRVVYDRRRELHAVIDGDIVYYYGAVPEWVASGSGFEFVSEEDIEP